MPNYVTINGTRYGGIGSYFSVSTWSFVVEPSRNNGGIIENLNESDRFPTFRVFLTFPLLFTREYVQFIKDIELPEFTVSAYDIATNSIKTARMYCKKEEQQKLLTRVNKMGKTHVAGNFYDNAVEITHIEKFTIELVSTNAPISDFLRTITFNPNGGLGLTKTIQGYIGQIAILYNGADMSKPLHRLARWNTRADGLGINYALGEPHYFKDEILELYAVWVETTDFVMSINYSGLTTEEIGANPTQINTRYNQTFTGLPTTLVRTGFTFQGFSDLQFNSTENNQAEFNEWLSTGKVKKFTNNSTLYPTRTNITIFAIWFPNNYTISFNSNGGTAVASITQGFGTFIPPFLPPTREGYTFNGWYTDTNLTKRANISRMTIPTSGNSQTFYAAWKEVI